ncbi:hypothetical protein AAG906_029179 [Vitis piasezkii]
MVAFVVVIVAMVFVEMARMIDMVLGSVIILVKLTILNLTISLDQVSGHVLATSTLPSARRDSNRPTCHLCGREGHVAIRCYHRFDISFQGSRQQNQHGQNNQHTTFIASPATINDQAWYIDSGVTNHITTNLNTLSQKTKYKGNEKLVVGNGQLLPISHIGKSLINSDADFKPLFMNHE